MALLNGCWFRAASGGTGDFAVASAITGYMTPAQAEAVDGASYSYRASSDDESQWEIGTGIYTASGETLSRSVKKSSNSNAAVTFSAAPKVALTALAEDFPTSGCWAKISSGSVSTPVPYVDIDIPAVYPQFRLHIVGLSTVDNEDLCFSVAAFSQDGGSTFINDTDNYDSYKITCLKGSTGQPSGTSLAVSSFDEAVAYLGGPGESTDQVFVSVLGTLTPGSADEKAVLQADATFNMDISSIGNSMTKDVYINMSTTAGRINLIRIFPYGNGDADPPTSGHLFETGTYVLEALTV